LPSFVPPGVVPNAQTGTTYTYLLTDRMEYVSFSNASSIAVTLPAAGGTGFGLNFVNVSCDIGAGTATITPTTSTISYSTGSAYTSAASTMPLTTGQCAWIYSDNTNYFAIKFSGGSGGDTITSPNSTLAIGGTATNTTLDLEGSAGEIMAGATPALTYTPTLGKSGTAGTLAMFPASGNFTTTLGSSATASNTFVFPATVFTTGHLGYCATSSTTCTWTDAGYSYNALPLADHATQTANTLVANVTGSTAAPTAAAIPAGVQFYTAGTGYSAATSANILGVCTTCVTSAAALTSNALMTGAGSQASQTVTTGTGVLTALGTNTGTAGAFVVNGGGLGTPTSGVITNLTGTCTACGANTVDTAASTTNAAYSILSGSATSGQQEPSTVASFTVNPSTGLLAVPGSISSGTAPTVTTPGTGFSVFGTEGTEPASIAYLTDGFVMDSTLHSPVMWADGVNVGQVAAANNAITLTNKTVASTPFSATPSAVIGTFTGGMSLPLTVGSLSPNLGNPSLVASPAQGGSGTVGEITTIVTSAVAISSTTSFVTTTLALPPIAPSSTYAGTCAITWEQATAASTVQFGIANSVAPTGEWVTTSINNDSASVFAIDYTSQTGTAAAAITASTTVLAAATPYTLTVNFVVKNSALAPLVVSIWGLTGSGSDALDIEPGSYCAWQ
ncbi:MAG: hypothetical protein WCA38_15530, partial [Candidatus Acidiferrales bacterium]